MKRHLGILGLLCTACLFLVISSCAQYAQEKSWSLVGAWINPAYDSSGIASGKVVYGNDKTVFLYRQSNDNASSASGPYLVEKDWTESGAHWFRVKITFSDGVYYEIDKLTQGGKSYESVFTLGHYPEKFDRTADARSHTVRTRQ